MSLNDSERLADLLAHLHFEKRKCVADHDTLLEAAAKLGWDTTKVKNVLRDPSVCREAVLGEMQRLQRRGISSIPYFSITLERGERDAKTIEIHGAAGEAEFLNVLRDLAQE